MADWQVRFHVIPRRAFASGGAISASLPGDANWWAGSSLPADYQRRLSGITSPELAATPDLQSWGAPDGNRIDVVSEAGQVVSVSAYVDVRRLDSRFGASLLHFVRTANAVLVRSDGLVIEPQISAFAAALRTSPAWAFANDPGPRLAALRDDDDPDD